ncbi:uncharacterized protein LOC117652827 [Thrips palmi]|uniref:Uncharacterized protein LOC117652827 n=1 Tax=Thrips palmi TaxID=161013 RepID=A0A6P9ADK0_THRPL|nr:uncharacterized protein LOC117652827 [Thrips palmi]
MDKKDSILAAVGGSFKDKTQFMILSSRRLIKYMKEVKEIFSDGTFCTPAKLAVSQIWNLVTERRNHTLCLARVLMQSRKTKCYTGVLKALKRLTKRKFRPSTVMADFEKSQQKGWAKIFPAARRRGCHFHYNKNIVKRAKKTRLTKLVKASKEANLLVGCLCALPLLPEDLICKGYVYVVKRAAKKGHFDKLGPLLKYVLTSWMQGPNSDVLSVYRCDNRTSNVCESDNASLAALLKIKHPAVWALLGAFLESEDATHQDILTLDRGLNPSGLRRSSALANDECLKGLWDDLDRGTISVGKFLRQASKTVRGVVHKEFFKKKANEEN